jgi:hypothetical protein
MIKHLEQEVYKYLHKIISEDTIVVITKSEIADYQFNNLPIVKKLKLNQEEFTTNLCNNLNESNIFKAKVSGPFINLTIENEFIEKQMNSFSFLD